MTRKKRRLYILLLCGLGLGSATALTLTAFQDNLVFFRSPSDIMREAPPANRAFRLGGLGCMSILACSARPNPETSVNQMYKTPFNVIPSPL